MLSLDDLEFVCLVDVLQLTYNITDITEIVRFLIFCTAKCIIYIGVLVI